MSLRGAWLALACLLPAVAQADRRFDGLAADLESGAPLYVEHHYLRGTTDAPRERLVLYRCPDGTAFARKHVRYGATPLAPVFELDDARFGYQEGVERGSGELLAFVQRDAASKLQRDAVAVTPRLVIDAGFDELVRMEWDALHAGRAVAIDFLVPSRRRTYRFAVERVGTRVVEGEPASVLKLGLDGVLGWFAPDLEATYRDSDRRLMHFEGLTNIRENRDDSYSARIEFPLAREATFTAAEWEAALHLPLARCAIGG